MEAAVKEMEEQLKRLELEDRSSRGQDPEARWPVRLRDLMYVDELKALHAIAQSKFDAFRAAERRGPGTPRGRDEERLERTRCRLQSPKPSA